MGAGVPGLKSMLIIMKAESHLYTRDGIGPW